jgi:hypothetical protein
MSHRRWRQVIFLSALILATPARSCGDAGSAERHVDSCTPAAAKLATSVTFTGPKGVTIAGLGIRVNYPAEKVTAPVFSAGVGVSNVANDEGHAFTAEPIKISGLSKPFMHATYKTCQGAAAGTVSDFKCTVADASDDQGNVVDSGTVSCVVTVP